MVRKAFSFRKDKQKTPHKEVSNVIIKTYYLTNSTMTSWALSPLRKPALIPRV